MFQLMSPTGFPGLSPVEPPVAHVLRRSAPDSSPNPTLATSLAKAATAGRVSE